jgi:hypothetical protein
VPDFNCHKNTAAKVCASTASIAIFRSSDNPSTPFFSAQRMALTVAHVGYVFMLQRVKILLIAHLPEVVSNCLKLTLVLPENLRYQ